MQSACYIHVKIINCIDENHNNTWTVYGDFPSKLERVDISKKKKKKKIISKHIS